VNLLKLSQKEKLLLEDQKSHEEMCIKKYLNYAQQAHDPKLQQLFRNYASQEQQHLNTLQQILNGQTPVASQQAQQNADSSIASSSNGFLQNQSDSTLCQDALMTEKYVSGTYNSTIFECNDTVVRQTLNHIQKEEQEHGEGIFNYMKSHGLYNVT